MNSCRGCLRVESVTFVHGDSDHDDLIEPWNWQRVRDGSAVLHPRILRCRTFLQGYDGTEYRTRLLSSVFCSDGTQVQSMNAQTNITRLSMLKGPIQILS